MMKPNQNLLVCESLIARLDVALERAAAEVQSTAAVEEQLRQLVSHLQTTHERLNGISITSARRHGTMADGHVAANENPSCSRWTKALASL